MNLQYIQEYSSSITTIINVYLVPLLLAIAFILFLWGVFNYFILGASDSEKLKQGRQFTLWGIIGFVIILSIWGLVNIVVVTLNLQSVGHAPPPPTL